MRKGHRLLSPRELRQGTGRTLESLQDIDYFEATQGGQRRGSQQVLTPLEDADLTELLCAEQSICATKSRRREKGWRTEYWGLDLDESDYAFAGQLTKPHIYGHDTELLPAPRRILHRSRDCKR